MEFGIGHSRPKSPTKVETKRKLQQFTGWWIMNGGVVVKKEENFNVQNTLSNEVSAVQLIAFVCMNQYFHRLLISS